MGVVVVIVKAKLSKVNVSKSLWWYRIIGWMVSALCNFSEWVGSQPYIHVNFKKLQHITLLCHNGFCLSNRYRPGNYDSDVAVRKQWGAPNPSKCQFLHIVAFWMNADECIYLRHWGGNVTARRGNVLKFYSCYITSWPWPPPSPSDLLGSYIARWQMKRTVPLNKIIDFSGFKHRWKHLGSCKYTSQQNISFQTF